MKHYISPWLVYFEHHAYVLPLIISRVRYTEYRLKTLHNTKGIWFIDVSLLLLLILALFRISDIPSKLTCFTLCNCGLGNSKDYSVYKMKVLTSFPMNETFQL